MSLSVYVSVTRALGCGRLLISSIIHSLASAESGGTYRRPTRRRERWKGRHVQVDEQEDCMAKHADVHQGCMCRCSCVPARALSRCACLIRARCPTVWFTVLCRCACGAYLFKSLILIHEHKHSCPPPDWVLSLHHSGKKMSRGISFPLLSAVSYSGKAVVAETLVGTLTWHCRTVLTWCIALLRTCCWTPVTVAAIQDPYCP